MSKQSTQNVLKLVKEDPSSRILKHAENFLQYAKDGVVKGALGIVVFEDGTVSFAVAGSAYDNPVLTLELIERLRKKIVDSLIV